MVMNKYITDFEVYMRSERRLSPHTCVAYVKDVSDFEVYLNDGDATLNDCDAAATPTTCRENIENANKSDVRSYVMMMIGRADNARSVNRRIVALSTFYNFLRRQGIVEINPTHALHALKIPTRLPEFIDDSIMDRLLDSLLQFPEDQPYDVIRDKMVILMLYGTGMRRSELTSLSMGNVDIAQSVIKVMGKGSKERNIPLSNMLKEKLEQYLNVRKSENICESQNNVLFLTSKGRPLDVNDVYRIVHGVLSEFGVEGRCSPHVLRHTFATRLMRGGVGVKTIEELLGHSSLNSTQIYAHSTIEQLKECYNSSHPRAAKK